MQTIHEAREIARAELARRRRRLGELTREQEMGVENLIMSTVTKVMEVAETALDSLALVHATDANRQKQIRPSYCQRSILDASRTVHGLDTLRLEGMVISRLPNMRASSENAPGPRRAIAIDRTIKLMYCQIAIE